jgi:hypothetical protein
MRSVIKDDCIFHVWKCNECDTKVEVTPDFYEENGTPVCLDCSDDMTYCRTEIEIPTESNNTGSHRPSEPEANEG